MNKSEIKEIKAFYSSKNKKQPQTASIPEIHAQDINANAMTSLRTDEMGDIVFKVTADGYSLVE